MRYSFIALILLVTAPMGALAAQENQKDAVFAAGCFWCIEKDFEKHEGVIEAVSGYAGGTLENPTYKQVSAGGTGHKEVVKVTYDPAKISYAELLKIFWQNVDPYDASGQFCDKGDQYRAAVFYDSDEQKQQAEASKVVLEKQILNKEVATTIEPVGTFYPAEDYHQNYYKTHTTKYKFYRWNCGRDARLEELWDKVDLSALGVAE